jgi:hypothetical protein
VKRAARAARSGSLRLQRLARLDLSDPPRRQRTGGDADDAEDRGGSRPGSGDPPAPRRRAATAAIARRAAPPRFRPLAPTPMIRRWLVTTRRSRSGRPGRRGRAGCRARTAFRATANGIVRLAIPVVAEERRERPKQGEQRQTEAARGHRLRDELSRRLEPRWKRWVDVADEWSRAGGPSPPAGSRPRAGTRSG